MFEFRDFDNKGKLIVYDRCENPAFILDKELVVRIKYCFILNLNDEQAWEIQCALLVKTLGKWHMTSKGEPVEETAVKQSEIDLYFKTVNDPNLNIIGSTGLYLGNVALYAEDGGYVGINAAYIDMVGSSVIRKAAGKDVAVASEYHVLAPMKFKDNDYLRPLLF